MVSTLSLEVKDWLLELEEVFGEVLRQGEQISVTKQIYPLREKKHAKRKQPILSQKHMEWQTFENPIIIIIIIIEVKEIFAVVK